MKEIKITLSADGKLNVSGPLGEKVLCLGMIELAKKVIHEYEAGQIVKPELNHPLLNGK